MVSAMVAAAAARKFNRPCRMILSRADDCLTTGHRHNLEVDYEATADESGRVVRIKINANVNAGISKDLSIAWAFG